MSVEELKKGEKRKRGVNFTPREVTHLFSIAMQYKHILENKQTNSIANNDKLEAWNKIASKYNATSADLINRSVDQLKRCYDNKKQYLRKKKAQARQESLKTGGGLPSDDIKFTDLDNLVLSTMDPLTVEGHLNPYDSDNIINPINSLEGINDVEFVFESSEDQHSEDNQDDNILDNEDSQELLEVEEEKYKKNWKNYNTNDLKKPTNPVLKRDSMRDEVQGPAESELNNNIAENSGTRDERANRGRGLHQARGLARTGFVNRRRPTATIVKGMASSSLAEKYEVLADKKNIIADHAIKKLESDRQHAAEEHRLKTKCLELDIEIRKKQLEKMSR